MGFRDHDVVADPERVIAQPFGGEGNFDDRISVRVFAEVRDSYAECYIA